MQQQANRKFMVCHHYQRDMYIRGLNSAGDFCYIEPGTVKFYLKYQLQKVDFQLQDDGTMKTQYIGIRRQLVFKFVRSDGTLAGIVSPVYAATVEIIDLYRVAICIVHYVYLYRVHIQCGM